jgi:hypothetical protein
VTLLLRMIGEVIGGAVVWLTIIAAIAAATALPMHALLSGPTSRRHLLLAAVVGAAVAVALAHRVGAPDPIGVTVWGRDLLTTWAIVGSAIGAALVLARSARRPQPHHPPEGAEP